MSRETGATQQPPKVVTSDPLGLLLVHGIGRQRRGATLTGFLEGMRFAYGDRLHIRRPAEDYAILGGAVREAHVFGQCLPMGSNRVEGCQCRSAERGSRTGPLVFSVRCSTI